jgi:hypothetical protein
MSAVIIEALPARQYLEELSQRMETLCSLIEVQGESGSFRDEALDVASQMVQRSMQLRNSLQTRRGKALSLSDLGDTLSGLALCEVVRTYDREFYELQNLLGQESHDKEQRTQKPDGPGRDALDRLERDHGLLHVAMRELAKAATA